MVVEYDPQNFDKLLLAIGGLGEKPSFKFAMKLNGLPGFENITPKMMKKIRDFYLCDENSDSMILQNFFHTFRPLFYEAGADHSCEIFRVQGDDVWVNMFSVGCLCSFLGCGFIRLESYPSACEKLWLKLKDGWCVPWAVGHEAQTLASMYMFWADNASLQ